MYLQDHRGDCESYCWEDLPPAPEQGYITKEKWKNVKGEKAYFKCNHGYQFNDTKLTEDNRVSRLVECTANATTGGGEWTYHNTIPNTCWSK